MKMMIDCSTVWSSKLSTNLDAVNLKIIYKIYQNPEDS